MRVRLCSCRRRELVLSCQSLAFRTSAGYFRTSSLRRNRDRQRSEARIEKRAQARPQIRLRQDGVGIDRDDDVGLGLAGSWHFPKTQKPGFLQKLSFERRNEGRGPCALAFFVFSFRTRSRCNVSHYGVEVGFVAGDAIQDQGASFILIASLGA